MLVSSIWHACTLTHICSPNGCSNWSYRNFIYIICIYVSRPIHLQTCYAFNFIFSNNTKRNATLNCLRWFAFIMKLLIFCDAKYFTLKNANWHLSSSVVLLCVCRRRCRRPRRFENAQMMPHISVHLCDHQRVHQRLCVWLCTCLKKRRHFIATEPVTTACNIYIYISIVHCIFKRTAHNTYLIVVIRSPHS